jgi:hypothetical protein
MSKRIQAITADEVPWVHLAQPKVVFALKNDVQGFTYFFDEIMRFWFLSKQAS